MRNHFCLLGLFLAICGLTVYGYVHYRTIPVIPLQPVYVEITTIDEGGHPVAGSQIRIETAPRGVSDSFGEWRGIVQARAGSKLPLSIYKRRTKNSLYAEKSLQIPNELSDTSELKTTVRLALKRRR